MNRNKEPWAEEKILSTALCFSIATMSATNTWSFNFPAKLFWENYTGFARVISVGTKLNINNFKIRGK